MMLWDEVVEQVSKDFPDVNYRKYYVDAIAARLVTHPQTLDTILCSNLFGDILTDIGSAISGVLELRQAETSTPSGRRHQCSNPFMVRHRISPEKESRIRSVRFGPGR